MRAIILAAGRGSRLKSLTKNKPKCFLKVNNKKIITHQIDALKKNGIDNIAVVVGYKKNLFKKLNLKIIFNKNWKKTNMIYSLFKASHWLKNEDCMICYGDIIYDNSIIEKLKNSKKKILLPSNANWKKNWSLRYQNPLTDLETFKVNKNGTLKEIGNKALGYSEIQGQFMGLIKIDKRSIKKFIKIYKNLPLKKKLNIDFTSFLNLSIKKYKIKINVIRIKNKWFELDNFKDLKVIKKFY